MNEVMFEKIKDQYKDLVEMGDTHCISPGMNKFLADEEQMEMSDALCHRHGLRAVVVFQFIGGWRYGVDGVDLDLRIDYVLVGFRSLGSLYTFVERVMIKYNTNDFQIFKTNLG